MLPAAFRGYDRRLWVLNAGFVVSSMGFAMVVPFVSLYFHEELGVPMSLVGVFFLVTAVFRSTFQAVAGELSDRLGRTRLMILGQGTRAVLFGVMALAVHARVNFWAASGILCLSYIAGAFFQPVATAAVSDLVEPERRLGAYSLMRVAHNLGWGVGPMLGGVISEAGYAWLFVFGAATSAFSAWLVRRHVPETHTARPGTSGGHRNLTDLLGVRHDRRFMIFCAFALFLFITMSQWLATLSVYASGTLGTARHQLGLMFGMNGFLVVVFQLPVTRTLRRVSLSGCLALGSLIYAVSFFTVGFAGSTGVLFACMAAITLGELVATPSLTTLVSLVAPPERTGRYMGFYGLVSSFGWSVGPLLGGLLLDLWVDRPVPLWSAVAGFGLVAAAGFWGTRGRFPSGLAPRLATEAALR